MANRVEGLSNEALLECFISGLKKELQWEVIPWQPDSITKAVTLAKLFEDKYGFVERPVRSKSTYNPDISVAFRKQTPLALPAPPRNSVKVPALPGPSNTAPHFKKMSYAELQERRAKGLCYNCDEKFSPQHKCPNRRLLLYNGMRNWRV